MTKDGQGRVTLHDGHAAREAPRRPSVYVYELWDHTSLILQYRAYRGYCVHRLFDGANQTDFNEAYAYTVETAMHEWMLGSAHRTLNGDAADFYYVPVYMACNILPAYDWVGPGPFALGYPMRPVTAMRMAYDALEQVRTRWPFFNRSLLAADLAARDGLERRPLPTHIFLFAHDEGGCWAPEALYKHAVLLTHWGRMDPKPRSSSRYGPDNWDSSWHTSQRAPAGQAWDFPERGGSRSMIGSHPCYQPGKDVVVPVFAPPGKWSHSPFLNGGRNGLDERRRTLVYFSGNLAQQEPKKYARGIRHRLFASFHKRAGWRLTPKAGPSYSRDLSTSEFCLVPPGGDGWSSRVDDAVRHGCIPVIIMDNVHMPFETTLNYTAFSIRVPESQVEQIDNIVRSVSPRARLAMREAMRGLWQRFVYTRSFLDADTYLGGRGERAAGRPTRLPRDFLQGSSPFVRLAAVSHGAPDAFETIMLELALRRQRHEGSAGAPENK